MKGDDNGKPKTRSLGGDDQLGICMSGKTRKGQKRLENV
jgi:hypothetical protein